MLIKDKVEIFKSRFLIYFSKIWKKGERYKVDRMGERAEPWPTPILTSNANPRVLKIEKCKIIKIKIKIKKENKIK